LGGPGRKWRAVLIWMAISVVLACVVLFAPWRWAIGVFLFFIPFNATAVAMIGIDPILVPLVLCLALVLRYGLSLTDRELREEALELIGKEGWLLAFLGYCIVSGLLFPRLFEGEAQVYRNESNVFVLMPLGPQNISVAQIAYLALGGLCFLALRHAVYRVGPASAIFAFVLQAALIGGLGLLQALFGLVGVKIPVDWVVNNEGATLMIGQADAGFARVTGVFTEASSFAGWAIGALALMLFLFLNRILLVTTGVLTAMLVFTLLLSTSSTAYGGLGILALVTAIAVGMDADPRRKDRGLVLLALGGVIGASLLLLIFTADYGPMYSLRLLLEGAIFGKQYSMSALERGQWASSAFQAGFDTYLLGAGYGAVRSSGVGALLFGAVGIPGVIMFALFLAPKFALGFQRVRGPDTAAAAACAVAIAPSLGVLMISGSDLGLWSLFWYYAAVAVGAANRARAGAPAPDSAAAERGATWQDGRRGLV